MTEDDVNAAQILRRSHCAKPDRTHDCMGVCVIDRGGVQLNCRLCGTDGKEHERPAPQAEDRAKAVVEAAGLRWEALSEEAKQRAVLQINVPWVQP